MIAKGKATYEVLRPTYSKNSYGEQVASTASIGDVDGFIAEMSQLEVVDNPLSVDITHTFIQLTKEPSLQRNDILVSDDTEYVITQTANRYALCKERE